MKKPGKKPNSFDNEAYQLSAAEEKRLLEDIYRSDIEKFRLFTRMLRNNRLLNKANITHK